MVETNLVIAKEHLLTRYNVDETPIDEYLTICGKYDCNGGHHILPTSIFIEFESFEIYPWNKAIAFTGLTHQRTGARWNSEKEDLYNLWVESGKLKKVKFSSWLSTNSIYNYTRNELQNLVKEFAEKGFVPPENKS